MNSKRLRSCGLTHPGRVCTENQDAIHLDDGQGLWLVTDGMGGHKGGAIASAIACDLIPQRLRDEIDLEAAFHAAHRAILQRSVEQPELTGLGTTIALVKEQRAYYEIAWSGDSRVYLWRQNSLRQLTRDHSLVQQMVNCGALSRDRIQDHAMKHVISSCLGTTCSRGLEIGLQQCAWCKGDRLLLCTDGLTDLVNDERINEILSANSDLADASQALVEAALQAGGTDNLSVVMISAPKAAPAFKNRIPMQLVSSLFFGATLAMAFLVFLKLALLRS